MKLEPHSRLGPYEVISPAGSGGIVSDTEEEAGDDVMVVVNWDAEISGSRR